MKELAKELKEKFNCLIWYSEKYITFSIPIQKELNRIDKNGE